MNCESKPTNESVKLAKQEDLTELAVMLFTIVEQLTDVEVANETLINVKGHLRDFVRKLHYGEK